MQDINQIPLFVEDIDDAVKATIDALGGYKRVAPLLRSEGSLDANVRWLMDCCNADRQARLSPSQLILLAKLGRQSGVHILTAHWNRESGYSTPTPIEPEDEQAALMRKFNESMKALANLSKQMERSGLLREIP